MSVESVAQYVEDRAGRSLRAVVEYDSEEYDLVFVRETLDRERPSAVTATLGESYASVQVRDAAVIINLIIDDQHDVLISMETEVCQDLHGFVTECLAQVDSEETSMHLGQDQ